MKKLTIATVASFLNFCQSNFGICSWFSGRDGGLKKKSQTNKSLLFLLLNTVWLSLGSFVATEEMFSFSSLQSIVSALGLRIKLMSDSSMQAVLRAMRLSFLRKHQMYVLQTLKEKFALESSILAGKIVGIIDGTHVFNSLYACTCIIRGVANFLVDFEPYTKGKELVAANKLLRRILSKKYPLGIDVFIADALYLTSDIVQELHRNAKDFVIKISESKEGSGKLKRAYRVILRLASEAVRNFRRNSQGKISFVTKGITVRKGTVRDKMRRRRYTVYTIWGLKFAQIDVYVQYVVPHFRYWGKTQKYRTENFFIVTSIQNPAEAVLLATERWQIEETFDVMKNEFNIKNDFIYKGDVEAFRRLFTIVMIAMNLIAYYAACKERQEGKRVNIRKLIRTLLDGFVQYFAVMLYNTAGQDERRRIEYFIAQINTALIKLFG